MYPTVFVYSKDSEIAVDFPNLGVATSGTSEKDAVLSAKELLGIAILGLEEDGEKIPEPTPIRNSELTHHLGLRTLKWGLQNPRVLLFS